VYYTSCFFYKLWCTWNIYYDYSNLIKSSYEPLRSQFLQLKKNLIINSQTEEEYNYNLALLENDYKNIRQRCENLINQTESYLVQHVVDSKNLGLLALGWGFTAGIFTYVIYKYSEILFA